jgi:hypothetical protein
VRAAAVVGGIVVVLVAMVVEAADTAADVNSLA